MCLCTCTVYSSQYSCQTAVRAVPRTSLDRRCTSLLLVYSTVLFLILISYIHVVAPRGRPRGAGAGGGGSGGPTVRASRLSRRVDRTRGRHRQAAVGVAPLSRAVGGLDRVSASRVTRSAEPEPEPGRASRRPVAAPCGVSLRATTGQSVRPLLPSLLH